MTAAQNFGCTTYGSFNAMGTLGYSFRADSQRSDYLFTSLHMDFDVGKLRASNAMSFVPGAKITKTNDGPHLFAAIHTHHNIEGRGLVQKWGEPVRTIAAGDAITIEPNEKHWHGAAPDARMSHFAVNMDLTTTWLEPVADDQYRAF